MKPCYVFQQCLSISVKNIFKKLQMTGFSLFLPNFGLFFICFLPLEHLEIISDQCNWSQMNALDVLHQFCFQNYFPKQQTELPGL